MLYVSKKLEDGGGQGAGEEVGRARSHGAPMGTEPLALASPLGQSQCRQGSGAELGGVWRHHCCCRQECSALRLPGHLDWGVAVTAL